MAISKFVRVTFDDGKAWDIPAGTIIQCFAEYKAKKENSSLIAAIQHGTKLFDREPNALIQWMFKYMDWSDLKKTAQNVRARYNRANLWPGNVDDYRVITK